MSNDYDNEKPPFDNEEGVATTVNEEERTIPDESMPTDDLRVLFILEMGRDGDGMNVYHFFIGPNADDAWAEGWYEKPAANIPIEDMVLPTSMYDYRKELRTDLKLDLAQNNSCFTMQDCRDHVIALAAENLDDADEYPEQGRIVIQFGDMLDDVEAMFARRNYFMKYI